MRISIFDLKLSLTKILIATLLLVLADTKAYANSSTILQLPLSENDKKSKNIGNKSSAQSLLGGWILDNNSVNTSTIFFNPDGTWADYVTLPNGKWGIMNQGTWQFADGFLYQKTVTGQSYKTPLQFVSNNEYYHVGDTDQRRTRIFAKSNLSANQLLGTWSIVLQERVAGGIIDDFNEKSILKLIELNPDGTFRYKSSDARFAFNGITVTRSNGTWEYYNNGYADGVLVLKNDRGQILSIGSINWSSEGGFLYTHRAEINLNTNEILDDRVEEFQPTNLTID